MRKFIAIMLLFAVTCLAACTSASSGTETNTVISTEQIIDGAKYLTASIDSVEPIVKAYAEATTDASQKEAANKIVAEIEKFRVSIATFTTVAETSKSATDVNDQYAQLKSVLNGLLAAAAPYLIKAAIVAI